MKIQDLSGKNVCILGFGREGQSTLRALQSFAPDANITIADENERVRANGVKMQLGKDAFKDLARFDVIIKSPGIPPKPEFEPVADKITNAVQIFLDSIKDSGVTVIGVTGSKGKSTTASLIHAILKQTGRETYLIGNIGEPVLDHIEEAKVNTFFVQEMSSYQLKELTMSPHIAVITSFFPEHLDYHGSIENYKKAKSHIVRFQSYDDLVFYPEQDVGAKEIAESSKGQKISFSEKDAPVTIDETHLIGQHNLRNIAAAAKVGRHLKIDELAIVKAIRTFKGLPQRLESLGNHHGIEWVDDAISTTPESTIAALEALEPDVETLIVGGMDRGTDFAILAERLKKSSVKTIILLGNNAARIAETFEKAKLTGDILQVPTMAEAVAKAKAKTAKGKTCLLSPASPSYDMFKNFEEKGAKFKEEILK